MEKTEQTEMNKVVEEMMEHVCDSLCKQPEACADQEELDGICAECGMGEFVCGILNTYNHLNDFEQTNCAALMKKYAGIVLCRECEYQVHEKSVDIHWCGNTHGLDVIRLKPGDGCSRGKRKEMLPEAGTESAQDAAAQVLQSAT